VADDAQLATENSNQQGWEAAVTSTIDPPPYQMTGGNHVFVGVVWDEPAIRTALPSGVRPVAGMTGGINVYQVAQGHVIGPYQSAYLWVDVEGYDAAPAMPARWMLAGVYGPDPKTAKALSQYYNLPVRIGSSRFESTAQGKRAIATLNGRDILNVEIKSRSDDGSVGTFLLHYLSQLAPNGELIVNQIPGVARTREAEVIAVSIDAPSGDLFASFPIKQTAWAVEVLDGSYSFSFPRPAASVAGSLRAG
jgi:hypothetical protein